MKNTALLATAMVLVMGSPLLAGGLAEPVMEPDVVEEQTAASNDGIIVPIMLLLVILAAAGNNGLPPT
jgi:hypothetical protein